MARSMKRTNIKVESAPTVDEMSKINFEFDETDSDKRTSAEMRNWFEKNKRNIENFAKAKEGASTNLRDITKTSTKTVTAFSRETLRGYLKNIGSNEKNLRNLSRYLYYRSPVYYRLVNYNANMFDLNSRIIIPPYDLVKGGDSTKTLKSYNETLQMMNVMNIQAEMFKMYIRAFLEDVSFGCAYYDETGFFILQLPADYCKVSGIYNTGDLSFAYDMSYFNGTTGQLILEYWGAPWDSMWKDFQSSGQKWQPVPDEYAVCLKINIEDWETVVPPYVSSFDLFINLIDLADIQAVSDAQSIYKMVYLKLKTLNGSDQSDDWDISPDIVIDYFNRMIDEALPDYTSAAIVPGELDTISFNNDKATDTNKVAKATETVLNSTGGAQILNSASIKGTTAFNAAIKSDTEMAIRSLLGQTQNWLNRFLTYYLSNPAKVKLFDVSIYTKDELKKNLLEAGQYALPTKLAINTLNGFSELDTLSMAYFENEVLQLQDVFKYPLQSSYTQSGNDKAGGQTKDDSEITDEGEASRDKSDTAEG